MSHHKKNTVTIRNLEQEINAAREIYYLMLFEHDN